MAALRLALLVTVTALVAAGCVSVPETPAGTTLPGGGVLVNDVDAIVHQAGDLSGELATDVRAASFLIDHDAGEPTVAITSDGTMFYAAATFDNLCVPENPVLGTCLPRTDILRSSDAGKTWEDVTPYLPGGVARAHPETGDPMVYVDPATDRVFDIDQRAAVGSYTVSFSDDKGDTWSGPFVACDAPPCDHQTIVAAAPHMIPTNGYANLVFVCYNQIHTTACQRSPDGGMTFQRTTPPFAGVDPAELGVSPDTPGVCGGLAGHLKAGPDGTIYLPKDHCARPFLAISGDDGLTWTTVQVADVTLSGGPDPVVSVDSEGNLYYVYLNGEDSHLNMVTSADGGATWSEPLDITPPGLTAAHLPALAAGDAGRVAVAFVGTDDPEGFEIDEGDDANASWHGYLSVITDALTPTPTITTARVNPIDDPLVRGRCGPGRCPGLTDFIDVTLDPTGRPWAAFVDACTEACVTDPEEGNNAAEGFVSTLASGPGLRAALLVLPPLP